MNLALQIITAIASGITGGILSHTALHARAARKQREPVDVPRWVEPLAAAPVPAPVVAEAPADVTAGTADAAGPLLRLPAREGLAATAQQSAR